MRVLLVGATVIDGTGGAPTPDATVAVEGERIVAVGRRGDFGTPATGDRVVDLTGKYLLPGFVNAHEHVTMKRTKGPLREQVKTPIEDLAQMAVRAALLDLREGVTTIRDMSSKQGLSRAIKRQLVAGTILGPNMVVCPRAFTVTGGYGSVLGIEVDSAAEARKAAREQVKEDCDWFKCFASIEWERGEGEPLSAVNMPADLIREVYEVAHHHGKPCAAHAIHDEAIRNAVEAGADSIEHGILLGEATAELMARRGVSLVPTLSGYLEHANPDWGRGPGVVRHGEMLLPHHGTAYRNALRAGVRIAYGSDTLGNLVDEVRLMQEYGSPPMDCIVAATKAGAELLGLADRVGTVHAGKLADLVVLAADPLAGPKAFGDVALVVKSGRLVDPTQLPI